MYLIGNSIDTCTGLHLAGAEGAVVHEKEQFKEEPDKTTTGREAGIVPLTGRFGRNCPDLVNQVRLSEVPLLVEIPDRHGINRKPNFITSYVNETIGLKL